MKNDSFGRINDPAMPQRPPHHHNDHHTLHHLHHNDHIPPHIRSSMILIEYDDETMQKLNRIYGEATDFALDALEKCPPEIKLTLALALGLKIDLGDYKKYVHAPVRPPSPLISEMTLGVLEQELGEENIDVVTQIYDSCPPEQTLLAIAVAALKNK